jgi:peptidoglycan hydrolase CwlO-like protein
METQLLLFPLEKEFDLDEKLAKIEEKYNNLRKSQHARISGLNKEVKDLKSELEFLKGKICKEDLFL